MKSNTRKQRGFTLLEMLVVLVLIGLVAGLVGPRLFGKVDESKIQTAETQIKMLRSALEVMRLDIGRFPAQAEGLSLLVSASAAQGVRGWKGPYLNEGLPEDPWFNPYQYQLLNTGDIKVYSLGPDGVESDDNLP